MQQTDGETIQFYKSNNFMRSWSLQTGAVCTREEVALSTSRAPPEARFRPAPEAKVVKEVKDAKEVPARQQAKSDPYLNTFNAVLNAAEATSSAVNGFQAWLHAPVPAKPVKSVSPAPAAPAKPVPPFDIQDIPGAMRSVGMPMSAKLMERWFAGALNYLPTSKDEENEVNQNGLPYRSEMIDTTSITMEWLLSFQRVKDGLNELVGRLNTPAAKNKIRLVLQPYQRQEDILTMVRCGNDVQKLHREFQFQYAPMGSALSDQFSSIMSASLFNKGVPDDLVGALGSLNLYAAVSYAKFDHKYNSALVTHISVYAKDHYTFTDKPGEASQYLGHWNRKHVALVPVHYAAQLANINWIDYPISQGDMTLKDNFLYPVLSKDFRAWQLLHQQGGDFIIYSDRIGVRLESPIRVSL